MTPNPTIGFIGFGVLGYHDGFWLWGFGLPAHARLPSEVNMSAVWCEASHEVAQGHEAVVDDVGALFRRWANAFTSF
jgi:hypothetical protein